MSKLKKAELIIRAAAALTSAAFVAMKVMEMLSGHP